MPFKVFDSELVPFIETTGAFIGYTGWREGTVINSVLGMLNLSCL